MNRIKRYYTAFRRYNRSKGYGVHSPFAYNFIRNVLREKYPYYAYSELKEQRKRAKVLSAKKSGQQRLISYSSAKMLFRIACHFCPDLILQIGTTHGVASSALLKATNSAKIILFPGENNHDNVVYHEITKQFADHILPKQSLSEAIKCYQSEQKKFGLILINHLEPKELNDTLQVVLQTLQEEGLVIIRNLSSSPIARQLWKTCCAEKPWGMSFTNYQTGIIVGYKHLPKQHFNLWF